MTLLLIILHVIVCILLIMLVLIRRGRGSGLVESFAGVESMFGTKTNAFLTRTTTVLSVVFFFTCLSLAIISVRQSKSLLTNVKPASVTAQSPAATAATAAAPTGQTAAQTQAAPKANQK